MTAPDDATDSTVPTVEQFRKFVGATESDDEKLKLDLDSAVELVDDFCRNPWREIPPATRRRWYLLVGAELFDVSSGPSTSTDPFGNSRQTRSSRDPLHVIMRQARRYVSFI